MLTCHGRDEKKQEEEEGVKISLGKSVCKDIEAAQALIHSPYRFCMIYRTKFKAQEAEERCFNPAIHIKEKEGGEEESRQRIKVFLDALVFIASSM